jgi:hypothetical protein
VINVRVRDENSIERAWIERWFSPIKIAQFAEALEHSAVDKHSRIFSFEQILRSCDCANATPE